MAANTGTTAQPISRRTGSRCCRVSTRRQQLEALGIEAISAIPPDFPLTGKQTIIRDAIVSGQPFVAADLADHLAALGLPACYLDFEAMMPPVPLYPGTWPYQTIPFQWSLHAVDCDGTLRHWEFLAVGDGDSRRSFGETLITALARVPGPILVYSAYERTRLRELAFHFRDLAPAIEAIMERLRDLLPIVRSSVYLPAFAFSNSIKSVAPALCPGFGYDDLEDVADGGTAAGAFLQLASGAVPSEAVGPLRNALLAYCERDTLAMVEVHRALLRLATDARTSAAHASLIIESSTSASVAPVVFLGGDIASRPEPMTD